MQFLNRKQAGRKLAKKLIKYRDKQVVIYALPRGGVELGEEIAKVLRAPLELVITRKIGHPFNLEYALAATAENGHIVANVQELNGVSDEWLAQEIKKQREEIKRRRDLYIQGREKIHATKKIAIIVDDGVATGHTIRAAIAHIASQNPKKIIVAVAVIPKITAEIINREVDELVTLVMPSENDFLGAVGSYYQVFPQVSDKKVIEIMRRSERERIFHVDARYGHDIYEYDEP